MNEQTTLNKLASMLSGQSVIMSDEELDLLAKFDVSNVIRSKPNKEQCGLIDRWQCWIERSDIAKLSLICVAK